MTNDIDEILSNFGNADYSKEFWERVNSHIKEENLKYQIDEQNSKLASLRMKDKLFGKLIGD